MKTKIYIAKNIGSGVVVLGLGDDLVWICRIEDPWDDVNFDVLFCHMDQRELAVARINQMCATEKRGRRAVG